MKVLFLTRWAKANNGADIGKLDKFVTLEPSADAVPLGAFLCKRDWYHTGGYETFEIQIPNRDRILFHKGNFIEDSRGCVLLGMKLGMIGGKFAIVDSTRAFDSFMESLEDTDEFILVVSET